MIFFKTLSLILSLLFAVTYLQRFREPSTVVYSFTHMETIDDSVDMRVRLRGYTKNYERTIECFRILASWVGTGSVMFALLRAGKPSLAWKNTY